MRAENQSNRVRISFSERYASFLLLILFLCIDYMAIVLAEEGAYILRRDWLPLINGPFYIPSIYLFVIVPTIFLCFLYSGHTYMQNIPFWKMARGVFQAVLYSLLTIIMLMYFGKVAEVVSRLYVGLVGIFSFAAILFLRYVLKRVLERWKLMQEPVLVIGAGKTAELLLDSFQRDTGFGYRVIGFLDDHPLSDRITASFPILGGFSDAERIIQQMFIQTVIIAAPGLSPTELVNLVNRIQPLVKNVDFIPDFIGTPMGNLEVETLLDEKIMMLKVSNNLACWHNRVLKRLADILGSVLGIVLLLPILLLIAAVIFLMDGWPIVFSYPCIGKQGKSFRCYKFRSMLNNSKQILEEYLDKNQEAKDEWEKFFKLQQDPRVTRFGVILRKTSLDELPQLINVLKGEMSLVGPRQIVAEEVQRYGTYIHDRLMVRPGITGYWQVSGRSNIDYHERVLMDSWYVRNWNLWIDMTILFKTIMVVLKRKGAY